MKNSIIFLCSLLAIPIYFTASSTDQVNFTFDTKRLPQKDRTVFRPLPCSLYKEEKRKTPRHPLETGKWSSNIQNREWEDLIAPFEDLYSSKYQIPHWLVNVLYRVVNNSGKPVDKAQQLVVFRRFMDAIQENKVEISGQAQSVDLLINDKGELGSPVLTMVILFPNNFLYKTSI